LRGDFFYVGKVGDLAQTGRRSTDR